MCIWDSDAAGPFKRDRGMKRVPCLCWGWPFGCGGFSSRPSRRCRGRRCTTARWPPPPPAWSAPPSSPWYTLYQAPGSAWDAPPRYEPHSTHRYRNVRRDAHTHTASHKEGLSHFTDEDELLILIEKANSFRESCCRTCENAARASVLVYLSVLSDLEHNVVVQDVDGVIHGVYG